MMSRMLKDSAYIHHIFIISTMQTFVHLSPRISSLLWHGNLRQKRSGNLAGHSLYPTQLGEAAEVAITAHEDHGWCIAQRSKSHMTNIYPVRFRTTCNIFQPDNCSVDEQNPSAW